MTCAQEAAARNPASNANGRYQISGKGTSGGMDLRPVDGDRGAEVAAAQIGRQGNRALEDEEQRPARSLYRMLMHLGVGDRVGRQIQRHVP